MGILKQAKNIKIIAKGDYFVKADKLTEIADKVNIEAKNENLTFSSNKKIQVQGKDGGLKYNKYSPPDLIVEEDKEYKLESSYAHDQLCLFADEMAEMPFMFFMLEIFGSDIEVSALSKLYRDLSDRKIISPEIIVSKSTVGRRNSLAGYSNKKKKIIVSHKFLKEAINDNDKRAMLLAALVEEYGHHMEKRIMIL
jgi:hypothetical protein